MGMESPPPTMIEGLGDEVTVAVGLFVLLLALTLAWLSTYVAEGSDPFLGSLMPPVRRDPLLGLSNPVPPTPEPQGPTQPPVEKPEEGERDSGLEQGEGSENANLDQMLDIQGVPKRSQSIPALQEENNAGQELSQEEGRGPENIQDATRIEEHLLDDSRECETLESKQQIEKNVKEIGCIKKEGKRQEEGLISVRLKFLNETEEIAFMRPDDTIGSLKSKYFPGQELQMKLIFQGQLLHDSSQTLRSLHIKDNCVIHCHRSQATAPSSPARPESGGTTPENAGLTTPIGNLMIPLFVIMLALIWYFRINYRQFFTAPATVSLVGVTVFFSFLVFGMYGR